MKNYYSIANAVPEKRFALLKDRNSYNQLFTDNWKTISRYSTCNCVFNSPF
jgi:hypothetical protein